MSAAEQELQRRLDRRGVVVDRLQADIERLHDAADAQDAEIEQLHEVINRVRALGEEIQRQADTNTNAVAPTYLRGVEQARIAARIRRALGDES